jgi:hypothetical protein
MYNEKNMFSSPQPRPPSSNVWRLLRTYIIKPPLDNRKKARCICDGSKRARKHCTIGQTFARCLAHDSKRILWAIAAKKNIIVFGADVSNAFAEAPCPNTPFFIQPDAFRDW